MRFLASEWTFKCADRRGASWIGRLTRALQQFFFKGNGRPVAALQATYMLQGNIFLNKGNNKLDN
jgi:hypothetical protein